MSALSRTLGVVLLGLGLANTVRADEPGELATKAHAVLKANGYRCHGQDGAKEGGFNFVVDLQKLAARRKVVPGDSAKSRLLKRILNADDPMPPAEVKQRPTADEIALLKKWI